MIDPTTLLQNIFVRTYLQLEICESSHARTTRLLFRRRVKSDLSSMLAIPNPQVEREMATRQV